MQLGNPRNPTFANIQDPNKNGSRNHTQEQHANLPSRREFEDPMEQPLLLLKHLRRLSWRNRWGGLDWQWTVLELVKLQRTITPWRTKTRWPSSHCCPLNPPTSPPLIPSPSHQLTQFLSHPENQQSQSKGQIFTLNSSQDPQSTCYTHPMLPIHQRIS